MGMAQKKLSPTIPRRFAFALPAALTERTKKRPAGGSGPNEPCRFSVYKGGGPGRREFGVVRRNIRRTCLRSRLSVACIADVASIWAIYDDDMTARKLLGNYVAGEKKRRNGAARRLAVY